MASSNARWLLWFVPSEVVVDGIVSAAAPGEVAFASSGVCAVCSSSKIRFSKRVKAPNSRALDWLATPALTSWVSVVPGGGNAVRPATGSSAINSARRFTARHCTYAVNSIARNPTPANEPAICSHQREGRTARVISISLR